VPAFTLSPDPVCTGKAITVTNLSTNANSYHWDWGDSTSSDGPGGQHTYTKGGNYEVQLTAGFVNNYGTVCQVGGDSMNIQVVDLIPAVIDTGLAKACTPFDLVVTAANATGAGSVTWTFFDNSRPGGTFMATGQMASYQYNQPGAYQVQLVVQNVAGCADTALHSFTVSATPQLTGRPFGPLYTCNTDTLVSLAASISYAGQDSLTYSWAINGQPAGAGNPFDYRFELPADSIEPATYLTQTTATNSAGCADTTNAGTLVIRPLPPPQVLISPDSIIYQPDYTFTFKDSIPRPAGMRYTWAFGDQNGESSGPEVTHQYGDTGTYAVRVELADEVTGCVKGDTTQVKILYVPGYLYVPDAICPGCSVAQLRTFLPKGHGLSEYHLRIYNAWGQLLFETTALDSDGAPSEPWTAQYDGRPVQQDAYRWQIEARYINGTEWKGMVFPNHSTPVKSGFITVIR
jgi:PKD repeat protein